MGGGEGIPRDESDPAPFAVFEHVFARAIDEVVTVLHRRDLKHPGCLFDLRNRHFTQARIPNDPEIEQRLDRAELFIARHFRIDAMRLPKPDRFYPNTPSALLHLLNLLFAPSYTN